MAERDRWNLESFIDSFIVELDKAQDTLAVKGVNRPLTYTVKDVALDVNIFPSFQDGKVQFANARPGDTGASRLSLHFGSITDRQIRETTKESFQADDVEIDEIEELDLETRASLKKVGVRSAEDIERMKERKIDVGKVIEEKTGKSGASYSDLAGAIKRARRQRNSPRVKSLGLELGETGVGRSLVVEGDNLFMESEASRFPVALWNGETLLVRKADATQLQLYIPDSAKVRQSNHLQMALDPWTIVQLNVNTSNGDAQE